jgi:hypothetical protein
MDNNELKRQMMFRAGITNTQLITEDLENPSDLPSIEDRNRGQWRRTKHKRQPKAFDVPIKGLPPKDLGTKLPPTDLDPGWDEEPPVDESASDRLKINAGITTRGEVRKQNEDPENMLNRYVDRFPKELSSELKNSFKRGFIEKLHTDKKIDFETRNQLLAKHNLSDED